MNQVIAEFSLQVTDRVLINDPKQRKNNLGGLILLSDWQPSGISLSIIFFVWLYAYELRPGIGRKVDVFKIRLQYKYDLDDYLWNYR